MMFMQAVKTDQTADSQSDLNPHWVHLSRVVAPMLLRYLVRSSLPLIQQFFRHFNRFLNILVQRLRQVRQGVMMFP